MKQKTFRLFVSSTFVDFIAERNLLNDVLLPDISDFCQKRGYSFQLIDLRWGIYSEAAINQKTLPICLKEIESCQTLSPRPNFLMMLGERYGWVPLPFTIPASEMERIRKVLFPIEMSVIEKWYYSDKNEESEAYTLRERTGIYTESDAWAEEENRLRSLLQKAVISAGFNEEEKQKYFSSATEQEVEKGFFALTEECASGLAFFRRNYEDQDIDLSKINRLKAKIRAFLKEQHCEKDLIELDYSENYQKEFVKKVGNWLKKTIEAEINRLKKEERLINRNERISLFYNDDIPYAYTYAYPHLIDAASFSVFGQGEQTIFITGESGGGKSTLLARFLYYFQDTDNVNVSFIFYGENEQAFSILSALRFLIQDIAAQYGFCIEEALTPFNYAELFAKVIRKIPNDVNHLIIIDGLDAYEDIGNLKQNFLPYDLPKNVKIIVSCASEQVRKRFDNLNSMTITVPPLFGDENIQCFYNYLKMAHRRIASIDQKRAIDSVLEKSQSPLFGKMLAAVAERWKSNETITSVPQDGEEAVNDYIQAVFRYGEHDADFVLYSLAFIAVAPVGLSEIELLELVFSIDSVREKFIKESKHDYKINHLPFAFWSGVFYDLKDALDYCFYRGEILVRFKHALFVKIMMEKYDSYCKAASEKLIEYCKHHANDRERLAKMLLVLLERIGDYDKLAAYLTDISFLDSYVRQGGSTHAIQLMAKLQTSLPESYRRRSETLLSCMCLYQLPLQCFPESFLTYAYETDLLDQKPMLCKVRTESERPSEIPLVYGSDTKIVWKEDGSMFIVYTDYALHVLDARGIEISSLSATAQFGSRRDEWGYSKIVRAIWVGEYVAVFLDGKEMHLYALDNSLLDLRYSMDISAKDFLGYLPLEGLLVYKSRWEKLEACSVETGEIRYSLNYSVFQASFSISASLCAEDSTIVVFNNKNTYYYLDAVSGEVVKTVTKQDFFDNKVSNGQTIYPIVSGRVLHLKEKETQGNAVFDIAEKKFSFINPPQSHLIKQYLIGYKRMIVLYPMGILAVNLEDYQTSYYALDRVESLAWKKVDQSVSAVTKDRRLITLTMEDFLPTEPICITKHNMFDTIPRKKPIDIAKKVLGFFKIKLHEPYMSYDYIAEEIDKMDDEMREGQRLTPTLIVTAKNGIRAIAYEYDGSVVLTDERGEPTYVIDRLEPGRNNNILQLCFSPNSSYLMIRTNQYVQAFSVLSGECVLRLTLPFAPVLESYVDENDVLHLAFSGGKSAEYSLKSFPGKQKCRIEKEETSSSDYLWDAYYPLGNKAGTANIFLCEGDHSKRHFSTNQSLAEIVSSKRVYCGNNYFLVFANNSFYLNGDTDHPFLNDESYDFEMWRQRMLSAKNTVLSAYVSQKNDLFSELYEYEGQGYLLLVCRMLNSLILFDVNNRLILSTYYVSGEILGHNVSSDGKKVTLFVDSEDREETIEIELPHR